MTGEQHDAGARLRELVIAGDLKVLRAHLDTLTGDDLKAARKWVTGTHDVDHPPFPDELGDWVIEGAVARVDVGRPAREDAMHRARLLTHGRLSGPVAAAKAVSKGWWAPRDGTDQDELVAAFVDHDQAWAASFAAAADAVAPSAPGAGTAAWLLRKVVEAHRLPVPTGHAFHEEWIRQVHDHVEPWAWTGRAPTLDPLRADPLLPDVVYHQLASGEVGRWPGFGEVLPILVEEGLIDRDRTLAVALEQLAAGQRPSSQKTLAGILTALEVRADEVPGGLDLLLSVLSSCHGSAVGPVLALAVDLVRTGDDAVELARVVAPRAEKGVRRTLLRALAPDALGTRIDHGSLLRAVDVLAAGDDDVAARTRYAKARTALGATPIDEVAAAPEALGLWDLSPDPPEPPPVLRAGVPLRDACKELMRTGDRNWIDPDTVNVLVDAGLRGTLLTGDLLAAALELASEQRLSPARSASFFEPFFLGGAMRVAWPAALATADLAASGTRPLPGLDRLLALLSTYAAEPPRPVQLPPHLVRLSRGSSKAALEARRLAGLLGSTTDVTRAGPVHLGLWDDRTEHPPWALAFQPVRNLDTLGGRLAFGSVHDDHSRELRPRVARMLMLDELAHLVTELGADEVRARLRVPPTYDAYASAQAVALWTTGRLTPDLYWRLARSAVSVNEMPLEWQRAEPERHRWTVTHGLEMDPPVMPDLWAWGDWPLEFLHTCEVLLLVERGGTLLSSPDVVDGSLGLHHLLERLARARRVGPFDLRLALARLRPTSPTDADRIAGSVPTDAPLTSPEGDREQDAVETVRAWVAAGGVRLDAGPFHPQSVQRAFEATAPTPWNAVGALSSRPPVTDLPTSRHDDVWRLPGRPDAWLRLGLHHRERESLGDVGGALGEPGWETVLRTLGTRPPYYRVLDADSLVRLSRQGRLDPQVAAAAASACWDEGKDDLLGDVLGWEAAFLRGAMRGMWPVAVAVVRAGMDRPETPAGVEDLLGVLRRYVHEVPPEHVPDLLAKR